MARVLLSPAGGGPVLAQRVRVLVPADDIHQSLALDDVERWGVSYAASKAKVAFASERLGTMSNNTSKFIIVYTRAYELRSSH